MRCVPGSLSRGIPSPSESMAHLVVLLYIYICLRRSLETHIRKLHSFDRSSNKKDGTGSEFHTSDDEADQDEKEEDDDFTQVRERRDISSETVENEQDSESVIQARVRSRGCTFHLGTLPH